MQETLQAEFRADLIKESRKKAFSFLANAAYDESRIPEIEKLRAPAEEELAGYEKEHSELTADPEAHKREKRDRLKELEEKISGQHAYIQGVDEAIATVQKSVKEGRTKAEQLFMRIAFFESFTYQQDVTEEAHVGTES